MRGRTVRWEELFLSDRAFPCCVRKYDEKGEDMFNRMDADKNPSLHWYACRIHHNRVRTVIGQAERKGLRYFIPMRPVSKDAVYQVSGERDCDMEPVVPSLLFLRSSEEYIRDIRRDPNSSLSVYCTPGTKDPAAIPDRDMELFIFALTRRCELLESIDLDFKRGDRVRITDGVLKGAEGYITRVHGTKRFIVVIEGVAAIATAFIPKQFIEKID